jgi:EpsI family protein
VIRGDVAMKVGAMDSIQRVYRRTRGGRKEELLLYIAYFGGIRGTAPHHPDVCMPGGGWDILNREMPTLQLAGFGNAPLEVHKDEFEFRSDQTKRLVVWWEYVHGENVASRWMQRLKWILPKFLGGKRGSILQVQVAQTYNGKSDASWATISEFIERIGPHLERVLPKAAE